MILDKECRFSRDQALTNGNSEDIVAILPEPVPVNANYVGAATTPLMVFNGGHTVPVEVTVSNADPTDETGQLLVSAQVSANRDMSSPTAAFGNMTVIAQNDRKNPAIGSFTIPKGVYARYMQLVYSVTNAFAGEPKVSAGLIDVVQTNR